MVSEEMIRTLREFKRQFAQEYRVLDIGVFGSAARGSLGEDSDVDTVVRMSRPDLFALVGVKQDPKKRLRQPVDVVAYWEGMNHLLKMRIEREAVYA